ncbi:extracellular solute-binding protein family 1 [Clostridium sp. DL-VIII]|uniref:ABC transporter substrate-binding protein n=1 Tax=Clostridium sp. DL-VIII TaxID=641107 RepID=UPI00023AF4F2|nr:extracellular solute-binding protein [Clostridium sp. DL-VIII]EHI97824.1 extracellular solute-binding protein family 1 [Clostridium sp. DL-VIII]
MKKNYLKKVLIFAMSVAIVGSVFTGCGSSKSENESKPTAFTEKDPKDYKGTINMWSFTDEFQSSHFIEKFNEVYPNIQVKLTVIPTDNNAYSTKLSSVLASGSGVPDVFTSEVANVNKYVNTDYYENLSKAPYNAEDIGKTEAQYVVDLGRNVQDNSIRALSWQATPGGLFYKRSLAKQYLGTDDPDEISKKFSSWDSLIETGKELNEKSGGTVKLLPNYSEGFVIASGSRSHGWVEDNKLVIDDKMMEYADNAKKIRDADIDAKFNTWSAPWSASMAGAVDGTNVLAYALPTWGLPYEIATNAKDSKGDWGLAKAPAAYYNGGTWLGIYSKSENKELAWQFVKFFNSKEFQTWDMKTNGDFSSMPDVSKQFATTDDGKNAFCDGQNLAKTYNEIIPSISGKLVTKYDETINNKFQSDLDLYVTGQKTKEEFLQQFKADVKAAFPDITVE